MLVIIDISDLYAYVDADTADFYADNDCLELGRVEAATKEAKRGSNCSSLRDQESR